METCRATGKRKLTQAQARKDAAWWRRVRLARMRAYRCRKCKAWHVGNDRPPRRGRIQH